MEYKAVGWPVADSYADKVAQLQEVWQLYLCLGTHSVIGESPLSCYIDRRLLGTPELLRKKQ
jgi:hypothetical protein